jgi:membrane associated rhomboid family serine protease
VDHASFYACSVNGSCSAPEPWGVSWFTAMFMHGSWSHILGNMWFLAIFGKNVEDAFGRVRYAALYVVGGLVATATQTTMTLMGGTAVDARVPLLGASGAIAVVGFFSAGANGGGTAFFAHVGGFVFGVAAAVTLVRSRERQGRLQPVM